MIIDSWIEPYLIAGHVIVGTALGVTGAYATFVPSSSLWGPNLSHGPSANPPRVALTFDDGPTPGSTDQVLDVLGELQVPAAFFVIGANAHTHPELVQKIHSAGHLLGNHTFDHPHYGILRGRRFWNDQLVRTDDVVHRLIGQRPHLFRPPMGFKTLSMTKAVRQQGLAMVTWNRRAMDGVTTTSERILHRLVPSASAGDIITLHDGMEASSSRRPEATIAALRPLVSALRQRGLQLVRLDELLGIPGYVSA